MRDYIRKTKYFENLSEQDYYAILRCFSARLILFEKGSNIVNIGDPTTNIYIIANGKARSKTYDTSGKITIIRDFINNDIFGIDYSNQKVYLEELVALDDTYVIACNSFRFLTPCQNRCKRHIDCMKLTFENLATLMTRQSKRIIAMSQSKTRQKIFAYLKEASKGKKKYFKIPYNQSELALLLGLERSSLSYELNNMKREGIIDFDDNMYMLKKKEI